MTKGFVVRATCLLSLLVGAAGCANNDGSGVADAGDRPGEVQGNAVTGAICPGPDTVHGLDVSEFQGSVSWTKVKADGKQFAVARIGDGSYVDPTFATNWSHMKSAGLIRGAYQFFRPNESPTMQANIVISKVGHLGEGDLPVMLDVEVSGGESASTIASRIRTWVDAVQAGTGKKPYIYTGAFFWDASVRSSAFSSLALNVAWYGTNCPGIPSEWSHWTFHQYTSTGAVTGISGHVDLDVFNGSLDKLKAFAGVSISTSGMVVDDATGKLHAFWRGAGGTLEQDYQQVAGADWAGWSSLGGDLASPPAVVANKDGKLEAFARFSDGTVRHDWQRHDASGWHGWVSLGHPASGKATGTVSAAANADGRLEVFVRTADGTVHRLWQTAANASTSYSAWHSLAGDLSSSPTVIRDHAGRLYVFGHGPGGNIHRIRQLSPGGSWTTWMNLGGSAASDVTAALNADGHLEIFVRSSSDTLIHDWVTPSGTWHGFASLGGSATSRPAAVLDSLGRIHVYVRGAGGSVHTIRQTAANASFGGWGSLGGDVTSAPAAAMNHDGRLVVVARGTNDRLYKIAQDTPNGTWGAWGSMGGSF